MEKAGATPEGGENHDQRDKQENREMLAEGAASGSFIIAVLMSIGVFLRRFHRRGSK
jgi:hypothetical protein